MQLSKLIIEPRVRNAWAAIDLGFTLARQFWLRGVILYLIVAAPIFLLSRLLTDEAGWITYLCLWWLKPLFERPILFLLSRELFSEKMGVRRTLSHYKQWLLPSIFSVLTIRRLSTNRGMYAPVSLLEQPRSNEYYKRTKVLGYKFSNASTWATVVLYHVESFLAIALLALFAFLFPDHVDMTLSWWAEVSDNNLYWDISSILIMAVVAPFYCASGFMLYICRRIELEGWDIEICFRDWMRNYTPSAEPVSGGSNV